MRSFHHLLVHLFPGAGRVEIDIVFLGLRHGGGHGQIVFRHHVREPGDGVLPILEESGGECGTGLFDVTLHQIVDQCLCFVVQR